MNRRLIALTAVSVTACDEPQPVRVSFALSTPKRDIGTSDVLDTSRVAMAIDLHMLVHSVKKRLKRAPTMGARGYHARCRSAVDSRCRCSREKSHLR